MNHIKWVKDVCNFLRHPGNNTAATTSFETWQSIYAKRYESHSTQWCLQTQNKNKQFLMPLSFVFFLAVGPLGFQHTLMAHQTNVFCKSSHNNLQWVVIIRKKATREALGNPSCIIHGYQDLHTPCSFLHYVHVRASFQMHSLQLSCGFQLWGLEFWHGRAYCLRDWEPCAA